MKGSSRAFPTRHASLPVPGGHRIMSPSRRGARILLLAVLGIVFFICYLSVSAVHSIFTNALFFGPREGGNAGTGRIGEQKNEAGPRLLTKNIYYTLFING